MTPRETLTAALDELHQHVLRAKNGRARTNEFYAALTTLVRTHQAGIVAAPAPSPAPESKPAAVAAHVPLDDIDPPEKFTRQVPAFLDEKQPTHYKGSLGEPVDEPVSPWLRPFDEEEARAEAGIVIHGKGGLASIKHDDDEVEAAPEQGQTPDYGGPEPEPEPPTVIPPDVRIERPGLRPSPPPPKPVAPVRTPTPPAPSAQRLRMPNNPPPPRPRPTPSKPIPFGPDAIDDEIPW